jgi:tRNA threonylcarbamoyladenosine biosynthesis protein TsaE
MIVATELAMIEFGEQLATSLQPGDWISIDGPLGAGKTVLCKGILRGLGYAGEVASPSYAIVHLYDEPDVRVAVAHADLYRLNAIEELDEIGLVEEREGRITLVEWAERAGAFYTVPSHVIRIELRDDGSRFLTLKAGQYDEPE